MSSEPHHDEHDLGLAHDLVRFRLPSSAVAFPSVFDRRNLLKYAAVAGVAGFAVIGLRQPASATSSPTCSDIPEETAGPFPGDGTNGPNMLTASGVVRRDIRPSFAGMKGKATGLQLTLAITLTDAATCAPANGYAVYLWHADQAGRYSLYSSGATNRNYLRGVQVANEKGELTFTTVFPGCYDGRWPHMHFEVFPSLEAAGDANKRIATSQIAFPKDACEAAYAAPGYSSSKKSLKRVSLATDGVFGDDGGVNELATVTGSVAGGFVASLAVTVSNTIKATGGGPGGPGGGQGGGGGGVGKPRPPLPRATTTTTVKSSSKNEATTKPKTTKRINPPVN
jgi:protocatechuate 3,4-dioxygenase beta subunit